MFKDIAQKKYLTQYVIPNTNISKKEVYNSISNDTFSVKQVIYPKIIHIGNLDLTLHRKDSQYFYIELLGFKFQILLTPMKAKFFVNNKNIIFDLFSEEQFKSLINELKLENPQIIYKLKNNI